MSNKLIFYSPVVAQIEYSCHRWPNEVDEGTHHCVNFLLTFLVLIRSLKIPSQIIFPQAVGE